MPVYLVTLTAPNGNRVSRPIVASCACHAIDEMEAEHGINETSSGFDVSAEPMADPHREMEATLLRMEARR
jgi:hypothetical protein